MKIFTYSYKILVALFLGLVVTNPIFAQCIKPVITSISNSGPACEGGSVKLNANGSVGGVSSGFVRVAGIGANHGNREMDEVFSSGDRPGSIVRISNAQFDAIFVGKPTNAEKAAAIKARYDVLLFTWASPQDPNLSWGLIEAYLAIGGSVFWEDDQNIGRLNDGTLASVKGNSYNGSYGCSYQLVSPAPFPVLVANGVNSCFANHHLAVSSWPAWMKVYIKGGAGENLAIAGIHPTGGGRLIIQGPDQDYHAEHHGGGSGANQYQILLNQVDFLTAEQTGISWTGPNGFTSNEKDPILSNISAAQAGAYIAKLTNTSGGGCFTTDTTYVVVNTAEIPTVTVHGKTNLCPGNTVTLTASAGSSYLWSNGRTSQSITVSTAGTYNVRVIGSNGCEGKSEGIIVNVNNSFCNQAPVAKSKPVILSALSDCQATPSAIAFDNGSYDADGDSITYSISPAGPFTVGTRPVKLIVRDSKGAISTSVTTVTVQDDSSPSVYTQNLTVALDSSGSASITAEQINNGSTDNCSIASYSLSKTSFDCSNIGSNMVILTLTDVNGNAASASATVTIQDNVAPIALAKNISVTLVNGSATITAASIDNGSNDACGIQSLSIDKSAFDCSSLGNNTVILTVTDKNGNVSSASAIVNVIGVKPVPSIAESRTDNTYTGLDSKTIALGYGAQKLTLTASNSTSASNATTYVWSHNAGLSNATIANPVFTPTAAGTYTLNVIATNEFGCSASTSITINVIDVRSGNKGDKVLVCHKAGNNKWTQVSISASAVNTHLLNGGYLGACNAPATIAAAPSGELALTNNLTAGNTNTLSAYPNPFAGQTTVSFKLVADQANVSLDLYDLKGVKIKNVYSGSANALQAYSFNFDGSSIPSGVYFFKLTGNNLNLNFKVIVAQ